MHTSRTRRASFTRFRCIRFAVLLLYVWAYLGTAWHQAFVWHESCEHGDIVDVESVARPSRAHAPGSGGWMSEPENSNSAGAPAHQHVHCSIVSTPSKLPPDGLAPFTVSDLPEIRCPARPSDRFEERNFPLYLLAPNHSPPFA